MNINSRYWDFAILSVYVYMYGALSITETYDKA